MKNRKIPRTYIAGSLYYVEVAGDHKEKIFRDEADYKMYFQLVNRYKSQQGFGVYAFCFVDSYVFLLLELRKGLSVSEIMHLINSHYTKYFNNKYNRKGHLFKERYRLVLIEKNSYITLVTAYIHLLPKLAGGSDSYLDYKYSSIAAYVGDGSYVCDGEVLAMQRERNEILGFLQGNDYTGYLKKISPQQLELLTKAFQRKGIVGSREFEERVKKEAAILATQIQLLRPQQLRQRRRFVMAGVAVIAGLLLTNFYFYGKLLMTKYHLKRIEQDTQTHLLKAMDAYYREVARQLEWEKNKAKILEEKIAARGGR